MNNIYLHIEIDSLSASSSQMVTANIWLEIDAFQFPTRAWNDNALIVLNWWTLSLSRLLSGLSTSEIVHFMEGPYAVEVNMLPYETLRFRALEGAMRTNEVVVAEQSAKLFILGLISQSREVLDTCRRRGWWPKDAEILESSLESLRKESTKLLR